jgi:hypothetical protein
MDLWIGPVVFAMDQEKAWQMAQYANSVKVAVMKSNANAAMVQENWMRNRSGTTLSWTWKW